MSGGQPVPVPAVALVGIHGHGASHLRTLRTLRETGELRLVALCDRLPPRAASAPAAPPAGTWASRVPYDGTRDAHVTGGDAAPEPAYFGDHREMLEVARPDVTVIATPPHTHLEIAGDAVLAGSDVLLEKPPVTSLAEHDRLAALLARTGRACQVGFQHLASPATARLHDAIRAGRLGTVTGIAVAGHWIRTDAYYERAPWAGRSRINGAPTADGALTNPFAHAVMQGLAVAEAVTGDAWPRRVEAELYRARDIEVDDTSCLRVELAGGVRLVVAVTLCAERERVPLLMVHGTAGTAELEYTTDRLRLPGEPSVQVPGRPGLLANLLAHRRDPAAHPLLAPLARTAPFTAVLAQILAAQPATRIDPSHCREYGTGPERGIAIEGVDAAVDRAAKTLSTFRELAHVAWEKERV